MEGESTVCHELKEELSRVQGDLKIAFEEKKCPRLSQSRRGLSPEGMDELRRNLEQVLYERDEAERRADDMKRLQNDVRLFKVMRCKEGYRDDAQGKSPRYAFRNEEEVMVQ